MYVEDDLDAYIRHGESGQINVPNFTNLGEISGTHQDSGASRLAASSRPTATQQEKARVPYQHRLKQILD